MPLKVKTTPMFVKTKALFIKSKALFIKSKPLFGIFVKLFVVATLSLLRADNLGLGLFAVAAVDDGDDGLGQIEEGESRGCFATEGGGGAAVAAVADALHERDLCQQGHVHFLCQLLAAFLAEDVVAVLGQLGRGEPCHILYQSEDGHVDLLVTVHVYSFAGIGEGHLLRR